MSSDALRSDESVARRDARAKSEASRGARRAVRLSATVSALASLVAVACGKSYRLGGTYDSATWST
jgi:hypothetical protein